MSKHIAVAASKGGTGKTTTAWNLGFGLALAGASVLIADCDPQDNLRFIADLEDSKNSVASAIENGEAAAAEIREGVHLLPSGGRKLAQTVASSDGLRSITSPLRRAISSEYDFVLFDCPPEFGRMTQAALSMADYLIVPCAATWLGLRSITEMVHFIDTHLRDAHIDSDRLGVALTFYTTRRAGPEMVRQEARKIFRNRLLRTVIRERTELDYSQEAHKSIFEYSPHSDSAEDYSSLTKEVLRRMAQIEGSD